MSIIRPNVERIPGYIPGEQPQEPGWIKLNTNENPYPPSPRVTAAIQEAAEGRLNIYPDPLATTFRNKVAARFNLDPEWVLPANGSDENLTILLRTFVDAGELVSFPYPSYVLYETLADLQGAVHERIYLDAEWSWNPAAAQSVIDRSKLVLVPNPNSPSGNRWTDEELSTLVPPRGLLVLDEAYGDFCDQPHCAELLHSASGERIVITRTLSKSYSLAGIRVGFALAHPNLITAMRKVKDSYNCNTLSLAAAVAALDDEDCMRQNVDRIRSTRGRLSQSLRELGFHVVESQANFVWATHPNRNHRGIYETLKKRRILIRYMSFPVEHDKVQQNRDGLRITVGTDEDIDTFLDAMKGI